MRQGSLSSIKQIDDKMGMGVSTRSSKSTKSKTGKMQTDMVKNDRGEIVLLKDYLMDKTYQI
jgi:hypothetical protein